MTLTTAQDTVIDSLKAENGDVTVTTAGSLAITDLTAERDVYKRQGCSRGLHGCDRNDADPDRKHRFFKR